MSVPTWKDIFEIDIENLKARVKSLEDKLSLNPNAESVSANPLLSDVCGWEITDPEYNVWQTTCGNATQIENDDTPLQNEWTYCPYCGNKIKEIDN